MTMRRTLTNLPVWAEFAALTVAVTAVSLTIGLLVRGLTPDADGQAVRLMMRADTAPPPAAGRFQPVVEVFRAAKPSETPRTTANHESPPPMTFDGRPLRKVRELSMLVTAYSPDERSCGVWADGKTASGYSVWTNGMKLVAADTKLLPFGTIVTIPGYNDGRPVQVLDRGGKIKGRRLDVLYPTHEIARSWGVQRLTVAVWDFAD